MVAVTISTTRGLDYDKSVSYTIDTQVPVSTFDMEVRYNLLDANSAQLTTKDVILFLQAVIYGLERKKNFFFTAINGTNFVGPQL